MKADMHPKWFKDAQVVCACGNAFTVGSTRESLKVEVCSKCHPFFTGEMKYLDTMGRVEKFQKKQKVAEAKIKVLDEKKAKKKERQKEEKTPKTLREMLLGSK